MAEKGNGIDGKRLGVAVATPLLMSMATTDVAAKTPQIETPDDPNKIVLAANTQAGAEALKVSIDSTKERVSELAPKIEKIVNDYGYIGTLTPGLDFMVKPGAEKGILTFTFFDEKGEEAGMHKKEGFARKDFINAVEMRPGSGLLRPTDNGIAETLEKAGISFPKDGDYYFAASPEDEMLVMLSNIQPNCPQEEMSDKLKCVIGEKDTFSDYEKEQDVVVDKLIASLVASRKENAKILKTKKARNRQHDAIIERLKQEL